MFGCRTPLLACLFLLILGIVCPPEGVPRLLPLCRLLGGLYWQTLLLLCKEQQDMKATCTSEQ